MPDDPTLSTVTEPVAPPPAEPQGQPTEPIVTPAEENYQITLDRRQLMKEFSRLEREDPEFANQLNTLVGRKAATKYQPEIQIREQEIQRLRTDMRRSEIMAMPEEEINKKFESDPQFAREYAEIVHSQPATSPDETPHIARAFNQALENARSYGVPDELLAPYITKAQQGGYDGNGQHWSVAMMAFNQDLLNEITKTVRPASTTPVAIPVAATVPVAKVNAALAGGGPDLSHTGGTPKSIKLTLDEIKKMGRESPNQLREILSTPEGEAAVKAAQLAG